MSGNGIYRTDRLSNIINHYKEGINMFNEYFNQKVVFSFNSDSLEFIDLKNYIALYGNEPFIVRAVFIHTKNGKEYPCVVSDTNKIWLPPHLAKKISDILLHPEMIKAIDDGLCMFEPYQYEIKEGANKGQYNSGNFIDKK